MFLFFSENTMFFQNFLFCHEDEKVGIMSELKKFF